MQSAIDREADGGEGWQHEARIRDAFQRINRKERRRRWSFEWNYVGFFQLHLKLYLANLPIITHFVQIFESTGCMRTSVCNVCNSLFIQFKRPVPSPCHRPTDRAFCLSAPLLSSPAAALKIGRLGRRRIRGSIIHMQIERQDGISMDNLLLVQLL